MYAHKHSLWVIEYEHASYMLETCARFPFFRISKPRDKPRASRRANSHINFLPRVAPRGSTQTAYSCDRCDVAWDGRNFKARKVHKAWKIQETVCPFLWSKWGNSLCWTLRNTLRVGPANKWAWSRMVDWGVVGCTPWRKIYFITLFIVH